MNNLDNSPEMKRSDCETAGGSVIPIDMSETSKTEDLHSKTAEKQSVRVQVFSTSDVSFCSWFER